MNRTPWLLSVLLAGVVCSVPAVRAETVDLKLRTISDERDFGSEESYLHRTMPQHFFMQRDNPESSNARDFERIVEKEPKYAGKKPFKGVAKLGSQQYPFVLDSTNLKTRGYDRLYFDRNHNGDLTDEPPIKAVSDSSRYSSDSYRSREFPRQTLEIDSDGVKHECAFSLSVYSHIGNDRASEYAVDDYVSASLHTVIYREGSITVDGKPHRIVLLDYNSNGRFNDLFEVDEAVKTSRDEIYPSTGDMVLVDPVARKHEYGGYGAADSQSRQYLSKLLVVDGRYYTITTTAPGDKLTLEPAKLPLGALVNANGPYRAVVYGKQGMVKLTGEANKPVPIPAGEWRLLEYQIDLTDKPAVKPADKAATQPAAPPTASAPAPKKKSLAERLARILGTDDGAPSFSSIIDRGPRYTLVAARATSKAKAVTVAEGKTETLPFGPPYRPVVSVSWVGDESKEAHLELKLVGAAGEICNNLMVKGDRPAAPTFRILGKTGELVRKGKFEFG
ncbi:MAG: hypothetical protein HY718_20005 [Planctomycetes bacterium]|nr:hypothetical protein [Planctomycetota bacterium]